MNPIIFFDEVDKISKTSKGDELKFINQYYRHYTKF